MKGRGTGALADVIRRKKRRVFTIIGRDSLASSIFDRLEVKIVKVRGEVEMRKEQMELRWCGKGRIDRMTVPSSSNRPIAPCEPA